VTFARTVQESEVFAACCKELSPTAKRLDEILEGVIWAISTAPEKLPEVQGTSLRIVTTDPYPDAPAMTVYFRIDNDDFCTLMWIEESTVQPEL